MADLSFDLTGRGAVVTGAGGDIGRAVVARLTAAGARVAALDLTAPEGVGEVALATIGTERRPPLSTHINNF